LVFSPLTACAGRVRQHEQSPQNRHPAATLVLLHAVVPR
jgi:hypothetical protein